MACRGCSSDGCSCSVTGTGAISVSGSGTPITSPYVITFSMPTALDVLTVDDVTSCTVMDDPHVPVLLGDGSVKMVPLPCYDNLNAPLSGQAFAFTWNGAVDFTPGDGFISFDSLTTSAVTIITISEQDTNGADISDWLAALDDLTGYPKGMFKVYMRSNPMVWASFRVSSIDAGAAGYQEATVAYVDHNGVFDDTIPGDIVIDFAPASEGALGGWDSIQDIYAKTTAYGFVLADAGGYFRCGSGPYTLTVPNNSTEAFAIGVHIDIIQTAAGDITVAGAVGVTINAAPGYKLNGQWASATLIKVGTNEWDLVGNLKA
jgi:hypothetical protein